VTAEQDEARSLVESLELHDLVRIDASLEGDWSRAVAIVWTREGGFLGFAAVPVRHPQHFPSIELIFPGHWLGIRCSLRDREQNVFDERLARSVIDLVERRLA
jgi:hypothetical protein